MGYCSVSTHRGLVYLEGLLLAVLVINFWCLPTAVQLTIISKHVEKGDDVKIHILDLPPNITGFTWYRGKGENRSRTIAFFPATSGMQLNSTPDGHMTIYANGSLLIKNVTKNDRGWYTIVIHLENSNEHIGWGRLIVHEPITVPTIGASNTMVTENKDAVELTCYTNAMFTQWLLNGRNVKLSERIQLYQAGRILIIDPVRREDAGNYQCKVYNPIRFAQSALLHLDVKFE